MRQKSSKIAGLISLLLALVMAMSAMSAFAQTEVQDSETNPSAASLALETAIEKGETYIQNSLVDGKYTSWWDALASGEDFVNSEVSASKVVFPEITAESKINDYINAIMLANVTGLNAEKAREWSKALAAKQGEDGSFGTLINQHMFSMIALNYSNQTYDIDAAIDSLNKQMMETKNNRDADYTAFAIIALSKPAKANKPFVQGYIDRLVELLAKTRVEGGYVSAWSGLNTNSTACALGALSIAGVDYTQESYVVGGKNPLEDLLALQTEDGSFKYLAADEQGNHMAAQQAIIALRIIEANNNGTKLLPVVDRVEDKTVSISVQGISGEILNLDSFTAKVADATNPEAGLTFEDVLVQALEANNIEYVINPSAYGGNYLAGVNGDNEGALGGYDGWLCLENGASLSTGFSSVYVENNSSLTAYYGDYSLTKNIDIAIEEKVLLKDIAATINVTTTEDVYDDSWNYIGTETKPVEGVKLEAFGKTYTSDAEGKINIPAADITTAGMTTMTFSKWQENAVAGAVAKTVNIGIYDLATLDIKDEPKTTAAPTAMPTPNASTTPSVTVATTVEPTVTPEVTPAAKVKKVKFIKKNIKVKVGKKATLRVKLTPAKLTKVAKKVKWSINKKGKKVVKFVKKAKKLNGKLKAQIKAKKKGAAKVTCTAPSGKKATCKVKVVKK